MGTVSRVLNGSGYVSDEARQRVLDAVRDLNYVPNAQARAMMTRRTMTLGVALPDLTNPYFPAMVRGIEDEARRNGYTVILLETDWQPANERQVIDILHATPIKPASIKAQIVLNEPSGGIAIQVHFDNKRALATGNELVARATSTNDGSIHPLLTYRVSM